MKNEEMNLGETPSLKQQVYEHIRMRIIRNELKPGTKLREEELSMQMGISRAPLREALNMLYMDGFTRICPRKGAVVREISQEDIEQIWELRAILEPYAAVLSINNIPVNKLKSTKLLLQKTLDHPEEFEVYMKSDIAVHALMIDYLKNKYLVEILRKLKDHSLRMRWNTECNSDNPDPSAVVKATQEHIEIIDAFLEKDAEKLKNAVQNHIKQSKQRTMKVQSND